MLYINKKQILLILLSIVGAISSLQAMPHKYRYITEAMKAGDEDAIEDIVWYQQDQDGLKYDTLDKKSKKDTPFYGKAPMHKAAGALAHPNYQGDREKYLKGVNALLGAVNEEEKIKIVNQKSADGATPLHILAGHRKIEKKLQKERILAPERVQEPQPISMAKEAYDFATKLIEEGADINAQDEDGMTPLHWAARNKNEELVNLLLEKGARASIKDNNKQTPVHWAAVRGYTPILEKLLAKVITAQINHKDSRGRTLLHWVQRNREGATAYEDSPPHMPKERARKNLLLLKRRGVSPDTTDAEGHNAFYWANPEELLLFSLGARLYVGLSEEIRKKAEVALMAELAREKLPREEFNTKILEDKAKDAVKKAKDAVNLAKKLQEEERDTELDDPLEFERWAGEQDARELMPTYF